MVKWWDLDNQHCFKTMVGHRTEVCVAPWPPEKNDKAKDGFPPVFQALFTVH